MALSIEVILSESSSGISILNRREVSIRETNSTYPDEIGVNGQTIDKEQYK